MLKENLPKDVVNIIEKIKKYPEVLAIIIFGSFVKGQHFPISDIDIAVILKKVDPKIEGEIGSMYSKDVDVVLFHRLPLYIQFEILRMGVPVLIRDEGEFWDLAMKISEKYMKFEWIYRDIKKWVRESAN